MSTIMAGKYRGIAQNLGGDSSNEGDSASSDDDDFELLGRRNLSRNRYKTAEASDSSSSDGDGVAMILKKRHREQRRKENIYGVFADSDDDKDSFHNRFSKKTKARSSKTMASIATPVPIFVKGQFEGADNEKKANADKFKITEDEKQQQKEKEQPKEADRKEVFKDPEELEWKRKQEKANQHFLSLLNAGKRKGKVAIRLQDAHHSTQEDKIMKTPTFPEIVGLGCNLQQPSMTAPQPQTETELSGTIDSVPREKAAFGSASASVGLGMIPSKFGSTKTQSMLSPPSTRIKKKDPNLGKWEKHTKGIGMKLLSKMGYQGSGGIGKRKLGATTGTAPEEKTGISRPIEVKVRPSNLGLGFGNFQEATKLKANRIIEAQVRGTTPVEEQNNQTNTESVPLNTSLAATKPILATNADLLKGKFWIKGAKALKQCEKKQKKSVVKYTELLQQQEDLSNSIKVIDMRGPVGNLKNENQPEQMANEIPVGEELLHNLSILLNAHQSKVVISNQFSSSARQKVVSLQSDLDHMGKRKQQMLDRISKLKQVRSALDEIKDTTSNTVQEPSGKINSVMTKVLQKIQILENLFSENERKALQFSTSVVPTLLEPVIKAKLHSWKPLEDELSKSKEVVRFALLLYEGVNTSFLSINVFDLLKLRTRLLVDFILPLVLAAIESPKWKPAQDTEIALNLFESIQHIIEKEVEQPRPEAESREETESFDHVLPSSVPHETSCDAKSLKQVSTVWKSEVVHNAVYQKLIAALEQWAPQLSQEDNNRFDLVDRPDLWILPWIPHFSDQLALTNQLVADSKRKIKSAISFLQKSMRSSATSKTSYVDDQVFFKACYQVLRPWRGVFKLDSIHSMVSNYVTSKLARYVASCVCRLSLFAGEEKSLIWINLEILFRFHGARLLSDDDFLSIVEGEMLSSWAGVVHHWLRDRKAGDCIQKAAQIYVEWKSRVMHFRGFKDCTKDKDTRESEKVEYTQSTLLLQQDARICRCFYSVLLMIQAAANDDQVALDDLYPPSNNTFRYVLTNRKADAKQQASNELMRMNANGNVDRKDGSAAEARVRLNRDSGVIPTFRDVVAEFARERGILFQPRMGSATNTYRDGKQIFLFGKIPVYLDGNVVFMLESGDWKATSLDILATRAEVGTKTH